MKTLALTVFASAALATNALAADESPVPAPSATSAEQQDLAALSQEMNNPLADLWLLFTQNDYSSFQDAQGKEYNVNSLKFQPVMSFDFSENYNLIVRPTIQHMSIEAPGGYDESGLGDTGLLAALGPKQSKDGWVLGGGFTSLFPTAEDDGLTILGADQTLFGPALVALKITDKYTYGGIVQHFEGLGDSKLVDEYGKEEDVRLTDIQYVFRTKISPTTQVGIAPNIQIDWNKEGSDRFTIPVGIGIDTVTSFNGTPIRVGVEAYHYVEQNDDFGPDWGLRFFVIPVIESPFS